ncbi:hypothetical protein V5E97_12690 [Singulisphaera sp. Ch08]|uniref:Transposase n=1 Tax=Singulisphaera sp. Ch08 TaxID=3120278 RepID=A0AAU7CN52_9BACT
MPRVANSALPVLWRRRLQQESDSGLSIGRFYQGQGISTASFHAWKRRLASDSPCPAPSPAREPAFVPVILAAATESRSGDSTEFLTIRLTDGKSQNGSKVVNHRSFLSKLSLASLGEFFQSEMVV